MTYFPRDCPRDPRTGRKIIRWDDMPGGAEAEPDPEFEFEVIQPRYVESR